MAGASLPPCQGDSQGVVGPGGVEPPDASRLVVTIHLDDGHPGIQKTFAARPLTFHKKPENQILM